MPRPWRQRIRTIRRRYGATQVSLAGFLGVSPWTVSLWERGQCEPASGLIRAALDALEGAAALDDRRAALAAAIRSGAPIWLFRL